MPRTPRSIPRIRRDGTAVRLREATLADAELIDARNVDPAWQGGFNDFGPRERRSLADHLADGKRMVAPDRGQQIVERIADGENLGDVSWHAVRYGPNEESRALNIGIALVPAARGKGYGGEAQRLLAETLFEVFDIARVEASTDVDNVAEQRSLEKAGFTREGVLRGAQFRGGGYHDLVGYSMLRSDLPTRERHRD
jgi:RimJ/RimL family protein N-acetyltransferase